MSGKSGAERAGFAADGSTDNPVHLCPTEIKHGRIAMLAASGYINPAITHKNPGHLSPTGGPKLADVPNVLAAIFNEPAPGWAEFRVPAR